MEKKTFAYYVGTDSLAGLTLLAGSGVLPVSISLCLDSVHNHVTGFHTGF